MTQDLSPKSFANVNKKIDLTIKKTKKMIDTLIFIRVYAIGVP